MDKETLEIIKATRIVGVFLWLRFTCRLPNGSQPVPISDEDINGAYSIRDLDGLLINLGCFQDIGKYFVFR